MGISGLLPALKPIQNTKHLSDFKDKVLAVDAYVWLHRGVYACASDLAMGKSTHKYVDYAMHRVRLLQHHGIKPYIVFDGGPLPAKRGTENDRKTRREESLAKGKALMGLGKASEAREHFIKSIDVTPQMAAQLMKALRAESIPFICAPYEADAQLAYLERIGIADAILTEDSDLLVFGCQTVLFKLDTDAATVVCISRSDFGSVAASANDTNGISLIGWSDVQFRSMAILSGCDYLPSIPGIGLKTACNLLKKWRTVEGVIKAINIAGKKSVPSGYLKQFKLAEKCFLHQRVYCPAQEKLVHLTEVGPDWDEECDAYVGEDIDHMLAKNIAEGHHCPTTRLPMTDINPGFVPRALRSNRRVSNSPTRPLITKGKGKGRQSLPTPGKPATGGILSFFGPNPIIPPRTKEKTPVPPARNTIVGKASGKRTLSEVMEQDLDQKKKHRISNSPLKSRFFGVGGSESLSSNIKRRHSDGLVPIAGPSRRTIEDEEEKENICITIEDDGDEYVETSDQEELDGSDLSLLAQIDMAEAKMGVLYADEIPDVVVEQEDGYISPSPSSSKDAQDLSSPPGHMRHGARHKDKMLTGLIPTDDEEDADFGADAISSPISVKKQKSRGRLLFHVQQTPITSGSFGELSIPSGQILVGPTPSPTSKRIYPDADEVPSPTLYRGPDLRNILDNDDSTELEYEPVPRLDLRGGSNSPPSPSPETPETINSQRLGIQLVGDNNVAEHPEYVSDSEDEEARREEEMNVKTKAIMEGWKHRWASTSKTPVHSNGMVLANKNSSKQRKTGTPLSQNIHRSTSSHGFRPRSPMKATSISASGSHFIRPASPQKAFAFIPGSRAIRPYSLKRSDTNVNPVTQGRSSVGGSAYKPPRTAPSQLTGNTPTNKISADAPRGSKPQRNLLLFEKVKNSSTASVNTIARQSRQTIDLTLDDDDAMEELDSTTRHLGSSLVVSEETILNSSQLRLSQYRCT